MVWQRAQLVPTLAPLAGMPIMAFALTRVSVIAGSLSSAEPRPLGSACSCAFSSRRVVGSMASESICKPSCRALRGVT